PGLEEMTFDVYANMQYGINPLEVRSAFDTYRKKGAPKNFVLGGEKLGANRWVVTSVSANFTVLFMDGRPIAVTFSVSLKEYVNRKTKEKKTKTKEKKKAETDKSVKKKGYVRYVVRRNDTLWDLAVKNYGKGSKYTKIYNANKVNEKGFNKITDPNKIYEGWVIKIPK
ncbi:MAG: LysM peptidoglycan-binding domain-containing protein, partial [Ruminococcus flavefaciens]|nr:LysM peptidoglycan-binding domain-containing protein [Ruminococcus flavefaciens]